MKHCVYTGDLKLTLLAFTKDVINLYELSMQLSDMDMTEEAEEEFQKEIDENSEKYVIELKETIDEQDLFIIAEL